MSTSYSDIVTENVNNCFNDEIITLSYAKPLMVGHGSFGKVFKTQLIPSNEIIAIKTVLQDPKFKNRELQIMKLIHHQNVVDLKYYCYKKGEKNQIFLDLILEYVPETLYQYIKYHTMQKTSISPLEIKVLSYQILRAINYINVQGICHRDIKPQNLLVNPATCELKLCDFGSAKILNPKEPNVSYACSRYYRAPELIFGNSYYSTKIDVWSIGCVIGEMILGNPLFIGELSIDQLVEIIKVLGTPSKDQIRSMNPSYTDHKFPKIKPVPLQRIFKAMPIEIIELMNKLLQYDPNQRITCIDAMLDECFNEIRHEGGKLPSFRSTTSNFPPLFNLNAIELSVRPQYNHILVPDWAQKNLEVQLDDFKPLAHEQYQLPPI